MKRKKVDTIEKSKEELLKELQELGVHPSGRKVRSDAGTNHEYVRSTKVRADKGTRRQEYKVTPKVHDKAFKALLRAHTHEDGMGDNLMRDTNGIFPPNITNYYKLTSSRGTKYRTSVKRRNHPEQLRWLWWMAEYEDDPAEWGPRIAKWYFIVEADISLWTYTEWAWSYVQAIGGHENRIVEPIILVYADYMAGKYGRPEYDEQGDIIWNPMK